MAQTCRGLCWIVVLDEVIRANVQQNDGGLIGHQPVDNLCRNLIDFPTGMSFILPIEAGWSSLDRSNKIDRKSTRPQIVPELKSISSSSCATNNARNRVDPRHKLN